MGETQAVAARYSAFISYSHLDAEFARRLQRKLESYRLPRHLAARGAGLRPNDGRLLPVFRDRDELTASADLTEAVRTALAEASYLIVICSPGSAASEWVGREVALFRELHGGRQILCALHAGEPETAIPAALLTPSGNGQVNVPLAADFRPRGDGERLALLKLVAVMAEVRLDELVQRDAHRRVQQISAVAASAMLGMVVAGGLAWAAVRARQAAERERARSETMVDFLLTDLRQRLLGVGRLDILDAVSQGALRYYAGQDLSRLPAAELEERATLLQQIGSDDETRGDLDAARTQFAEAARTTAALLDAKPDDPDRIKAHGDSEFYVGDIDEHLGDDDGVLAHWSAYAMLAKRLIQTSPNNPDYMVEAADADTNLAQFTLQKSVDTAYAMPRFEAALAYYQAAQRQEVIGPDGDIRIQIADQYAWLADTERLRGDNLAALHDRQQQRDIIETLLAKDPRNFDTRFYLVRNTLGLARVDAANHYWQGATALLRAAYDEAMALQREEPANARLAKQARFIALFQARTWLSMPVSDQPGAAAIAAAIGDCDAEWAKANNEELASFCTIQQARALAAGGDQPGATRLLARLHLERPARNRLTDWWLLDMREEAKLH